METLNKKPVISKLKPLTYSMLINQDKKNKLTVLNLKDLVTNFELDITLKDNISQIKHYPAFISKSYYQIQNLDKPDKLDFSYNYPPKGPIELGFICPYCEREGSNYHKENCRRPFNSSLVLANKTSLFPGAEEGTSYELIVKKSGQKKIISKRARSETFTDNVEIFYENEKKQQAVIRVSRNGTINIISASINDEELPELIVYRINKTKAVVHPPFVINSSYRYLISAQFNIFPEQFNKDLLINLNTLHNNLWTIPLFKKTIDGKTSFTVSDNYYFVSKYNYNSGEQYSRSHKLTNPYIQFTLIHPDIPDIKTHVMVYVRGAVQLRASYVNENKITDLEYSILENVYVFLRLLFGNLIIYSNKSNYDIIETEIKPLKKSKIPNMVDGGQPQNCHNRPGTKPGSGDFRPVPYSFYGVCPMPGYFVPPRGVKQGKKFAPCCKEFKKSGKDTEERYNDMLLNGYPDKLAAFYGETVTPGDSAVFVPGTKIVEPRSFPGLNNMTKKQLTNCMDNYIREDNLFDLNKSTKSLNVKFKKLKSLLNFEPFTKMEYMITPIYNDTIRVKLYFDESGVSYFINVIGDVSESGIEPLPELAQTELDGYFYPYPDPDFMFYPFDISMYRGQDISGFNYYSGQFKRWEFLKTAESKIKRTYVKIKTSFDLNIVRGSNNYLKNDNVLGLLFIPYTSGDILLWSDSLHNYNLVIGLEVTLVSGNRWKVTVEGKTLPKNLVQQNINNDIELPVSFTKGKGNAFIASFKINIKRTDFKIENRKPFIPLEILDQQINSYQEVINILESINHSISRETFENLNENPFGFIFNNKLYYFTAIGQPLKVQSI